MVSFKNFTLADVHLHFIRKLKIDYSQSVKVKILSEHSSVEDTYFLYQDDFLEPIKKLVEGDDAHDPIQPGEIYVLPIAIPGHLFVSVLLKNF